MPGLQCWLLVRLVRQLLWALVLVRQLKCVRQMVRQFLVRHVRLMRHVSICCEEALVAALVLVKCVRQMVRQLVSSM